jgi:peptide/nickel transport system ATP-binding protein/oligopeptide transport system ATP-binding protein
MSDPMTTSATAPAPQATRSTELLRVRGLVKHFPVYRGLLRRPVGAIHAVDSVDFTIEEGATLGLVGESGCGKTTTGRMVAGLVRPTRGSIVHRGTDLAAMTPRQLRAFRPQVQVMFQDPYASLSPRMTVHDIVAEPLRIQGRYRGGGDARVSELLELVGLARGHSNRYVHEFSGGQRQRIGLARSLALGPSLVVLDEPVSALDMSIQAQILTLLGALQRELGLSYLLISHDLSVVRHMSRRVAVMYLGVIVEAGPAREVLTRPRHPYTVALISAVPTPDPRGRESRTRIELTGELPGASNPPSGCRFRTRCWKAQGICASQQPILSAVDDTGHQSACHFPENPGDVRNP